jgi:uncharacterized membrane protein YkgB
MRQTFDSIGDRQFPARALDGIDWIRHTGRSLALIGTMLPLLLIGGLKFTQIEIEALTVRGGTMAALTFLVTSSLLVALPIWEAKAGGFPALNILRQFLLKDVALLGIALFIAGEGFARMRGSDARPLTGGGS